MRPRGFEPYLSAKLTETQAAARSALAVLRDVEWKGLRIVWWETEVESCPSCRACRDEHTNEEWTCVERKSAHEKHEEDCALAAAIRFLEDSL